MYPDTVGILILQQTGAGYEKEQRNTEKVHFEWEMWTLQYSISPHFLWLTGM